LRPAQYGITPGRVFFTLLVDDIPQQVADDIYALSRDNALRANGFFFSVMIQ